MVIFHSYVSLPEGIIFAGKYMGNSKNLPFFVKFLLHFVLVLWFYLQNSYRPYINIMSYFLKLGTAIRSITKL